MCRVNTTLIMADTVNVASGEGSPVNTQTCSICIESFKEPKLLPCFHTFCCNCLEQFVSKSAVNGTFFCPVCRFQVTLPDSGVKGFQTNFYIEAYQVKRENEGARCEICSNTAVNRCRQCKQTLCEPCTGVHNRLSLTRSHSLVHLQETSKDYPAISKPEFCPKHKGELFRFHCKKCEKAICRDCKLTSHEGHQTLDLEDVIEEGRHLLAKLKVDFDLLVPVFERTIQQISEKKKSFSEVVNETVKEVNATADRLIMMVNEARDSKLKEIDNIRSTETSHLNNTEISVTQDKLFLQSHINHISTLLTEGCGADILNTLPDMRQRLAGLTNQTPLAPKVNNHEVIKLSVSGGKRRFRRSDIDRIIMPVKEHEVLAAKCVFQCTGTVDFICPVSNGQAWVGLRRQFGKCMLTLFSEKGVMIKGFHVSKERYEACRMGGILRLLHDGDYKGKTDEILAFEKDVKLKQRPHSDTRNKQTCHVNVIKRIVVIGIENGGREFELSPLELSSAPSSFAPRDACWGVDGDLLIADMGSNSVLLLKKNYSTLTSYKVSQNVDFRPCAVAVCQNGSLWVGEENGRVSILQSNVFYRPVIL